MRKKILMLIILTSILVQKPIQAQAIDRQAFRIKLANSMQIAYRIDFFIQSLIVIQDRLSILGRKADDREQDKINKSIDNIEVQIGNFDVELEKVMRLANEAESAIASGDCLQCMTDRVEAVSSHAESRGTWRDHDTCPLFAKYLL